jgi:ribonuclease BN (tRNA processing enzyme)
MKFQLLPSTFDENGCASPKQHLACFVVDDCVAIDAGSLAMASGARQKKQIRDIVLTHAHLDHIAGLPLFIDDLFAALTEPIRVHATTEVIQILERDIFNWDIYPRFSELRNDAGAVLEYRPFEIGKEFSVKHLNFKSASVNHKVPTVGFVVSDCKTTFAISGDTAEMNEFWEAVNKEESLDAILIECAFPNELEGLARDSHHLTPKSLQKEITRLQNKICPVYIINMKPMYRDEIVSQIADLKIENLQILEVGRIYDW